ncbi:tyrosine-protein kinase Etk/Wzc [Paraburkholderia sp. HC6.4b]|uniref:polysaccharide biosynthesis tyrosine autokinase n=1 Tax=unclassified Paraburkholderia TaxID=2615204 RepID=UPI0016176C1E|nr:MULTISPECIES: polysaccharide biosynthesis tyrosine autokinase [unclassified Paraburkholderia]MBB5409193.1 tyrosine-protein kinase Etk/Wzc [Paraburkholderia sp. HC6.4b]MBB5450921.1 tyrosine-protein kinase Etk/Wzc [Paraburkholderia sp. Kb1A]
MKSLQSPENEALKPDDEIDLIGLLDVLIEYRWIILKICLACLVFAAAFAFLFPPRYQADISIQVEDGSAMASAQSLLGDVSSLFDYNSPTSAEQQIMASRLVVTSVVDELHSYIVVRPSRFPLIGNFISRFNDTVMRPGILGIGGWAWGTESADVVQFDVPKRVEGNRFALTVLSGGRYRLSGWHLDGPVTGRVGETEVFATSYGPVTLLVKSINAAPGTKFKLIRTSRLDAITSMQNGLNIQEKIKSSGVLIATLKGADPVLVRDQLQAVGRYYVKQNIERKAAQAAQSLAFLNTQIPQLKAQLEDAQARYTQMRNKQGSVDFTEEAKLVLQQTADAKIRMLELRQKRDVLAARFTPSHPNVIALDAQIATLRAQQSVFDEQVKRMPDMQQDAVRLMLDVKVDTDLYTALLNNVQQLKLVKAGKTGTVRVVDVPVVPEDVAFPNRPVTIAAGALLGLLLGVGFAVAHSFLFAGIAEAEEIENLIGLHVYATIPASRRQEQINRAPSDNASGVRLLAADQPGEPAVESLRSLRTALRFAMLNAKDNVILISGPTPGVGKSFVSANFAALLATGGKRVLVIDMDLRRGSLHQYFGKQRERGVTDVIAGMLSLDQVIHRNVVSNLDFISTGELPLNAAELLMHERVGQLLESSSRDYDFVLVDSPPVLAVTDAAMLSEHCATVMLVAWAGRTRVAELAESVKRFAQTRSVVTGAILNRIDPKSARLSYGRKNSTYRYVQYSYEEPRLKQVPRWRQLIARIGWGR